MHSLALSIGPLISLWSPMHSLALSIGPLISLWSPMHSLALSIGPLISLWSPMHSLALSIGPLISLWSPMHSLALSIGPLISLWSPMHSLALIETDYSNVSAVLFLRIVSSIEYQDSLTFTATGYLPSLYSFYSVTGPNLSMIPKANTFKSN